MGTFLSKEEEQRIKKAFTGVILSVIGVLLTAFGSLWLLEAAYHRGGVKDMIINYTDGSRLMLPLPIVTTSINGMIMAIAIGAFMIIAGLMIISLNRRKENRRRCADCGRALSNEIDTFCKKCAPKHRDDEPIGRC